MGLRQEGSEELRNHWEGKLREKGARTPVYLCKERSLGSEELLGTARKHQIKETENVDNEQPEMLIPSL